ncbi:putative E3 ubiquitin-protein ligase DTX3, partial [Clarias magur]
MAEMRHTVCVRGLPTDMERERLEDKLMIHFLRERNGGGEISSISIKAADPYAVITFEDTRVALNVCSHSPHVLEVDGKLYELSLSFPGQESMHLNKCILDMSVTIDCKRLPLGEETIKTITEQFPDLTVNYIKPQRHCTLKGCYTEVKDMVAYLTELLVDFEPPHEESDRGHLHHKGQDDPSDQSHGPHFGGDVSLHQECLNVNGLKESQAQAHSDEKLKDWVDAVSVEALSLIMEADVFAYLCNRSEKYQSILQNHGVHVVDVTSAGVTTLYLQSNANGKTGSKAEKHLHHARHELSQLYQQVEGNLRRTQIPRSALKLDGEQTAAFKDVESLLPKVLISYDQTHVYIVGESSEVSQAKQILQIGSPNENLRAKQEIAFPSSPSGSYSPIAESETMQMAVANSESSTITPKMRNSDAERGVRTGEEYRLAARFKNSDMGLLGFGHIERGRTKESQDLTKAFQTLPLGSNSGPNLSTNSSLGNAVTVNSDQNRTSQFDAFKFTGVNNVEDDIPFQTMEPPPITGTLKNRGLVSNKNKTNSVIGTPRVAPAFIAPLNTPVNDLTRLEKTPTGPTIDSTTTSTSSLRRANSFSGQQLQKQMIPKTVTDEKSCLATHSFRRPRSSSLNRMSAQTLKSSTVSKDIIVPTLRWSYIKEAYQSDLKSLLSDLQVSENQIDKSKTMVILKGSASSKVEECQHELQKLVDGIGLDFCVQNLKLADLGVTEGNDMLKECCWNIRSHFSKIVLQHVKDAVFLMGPKSQCFQAIEMLKELFPNALSHSGSLVDTYAHHGSIDPSQANALANQTLIKSSSQIRPYQTKANSESAAKDRLKGCKFESMIASYVQSPKPVAKDILKKASDLEISKTSLLPGKFSEVSGVPLGPRDDWQKPSSLTMQKSQKATMLPLKQTNFPVCKQLGTCVCGENGTPTSCGVVLCSECILLHTHCTECTRVNEARKASKETQVLPLKEDQNTEELKGKEAGTRPKQEQGIQGTMMCTELSVKLPGFEQYRTVKITYSIPDGIQGEEHPNPGLPFQGGVFDAYLPLISKGQGLLKCLEKAFKQGFTFTVCPSRAKIAWSRIPHKTKITGGRSG